MGHCDLCKQILWLQEGAGYLQIWWVPSHLNVVGTEGANEAPGYPLATLQAPQGSRVGRTRFEAHGRTPSEVESGKETVWCSLRLMGLPRRGAAYNTGMSDTWLRPHLWGDGDYDGCL